MIPSIMKNKTFKKIVYALISFIFWILLWEICARIINIGIILPKPIEVASALFLLITTVDFWKITLFSILRILLGFIIGIAIGILTAVLTHHMSIINAILSPFMTVVRATPVASFIMVLWLLIGSSAVPTVITVLMVTPIVWQNLSDGFSAIDKELVEVCDAYEIPSVTRFKILIAPTLKNYLIPGIITSASLGWKSGIAAEIIAYTKNSIGKEILIAKSFLESAEMLAWTMIVIIFSLVFEYMIRYVGRRYKNNGVKT